VPIVTYIGSLFYKKNTSVEEKKTNYWKKNKNLL
jgi:hypothetical protein